MLFKMQTNFLVMSEYCLEYSGKTGPSSGSKMQASLMPLQEPLGELRFCNVNKSDLLIKQLKKAQQDYFKVCLVNLNWF